MDEMIKVSVIIPIYNAELYLEQCLDSILNQTLKEIEVICVDDGSTDNSGEILEKFAKADERIRLIVLPHSHGGAGFPRNKGLEAAAGKYLSVLDADDFFDIHMRKEMYDIAEKTNADAVWCDAYYYNDETERILPATTILNSTFLPLQEVFSKEDIQDKLFQLKDGQAWNGLYRSDFIKENQIRFQENICIADDMLFSYSVLLYSEKMCTIDHRYIYYRINNNGSQNSNSEKHPTVHCDAFEALRTVMEQNGWWDIYKKSFCNIAVEHFMRILGRMKSYTSFEQLYNRLRTNTLQSLGLLECKEPDFEHRDRFLWVHDIERYEPAEYLMKMKSEYVYPEITLIPLTRFPEDVIPKDSEIVIYGGGEIGKTWFTQLLFSKWCKVVAWVDRDADALGYPLQSPEELYKKQFDYILLAVIGEKVAKEITENLVAQGMEEQKIIWTHPR